MSFAVTWLAGWAAAATGMAVLWLAQRRTRRADWVDVAWTVGTGSLAMAFALSAGGDAARQGLIAAFAGIWSLRLTWHLAARLRNSAEDGRYVRLRRRHGDSADLWLFGFFQVQALLCAFFAAPALIAARNQAPVGWPEVLGAFVWALAVAGETLADRQLKRFRDSGSGVEGLPNRTVEILEAPELLLRVASLVELRRPVGWQAPHGWLTLAGPAAMLLLIWKVTGIPPTEEQAVARRGEAYRRYQREVSPFFPRRPREASR